MSAYDDGDAVIVHLVGQTLSRMTIDVERLRVSGDTLDAAPQVFGRVNERFAVSDHCSLYTVAGGRGSVDKHDLTAGTSESHALGAGRQPGEFLFVEDPGRSSTEMVGWLVGLVHDDADDQSSLVVLDATEVTGAAVATVTIPRRVPLASVACGPRWTAESFHH